jgi:hypothetical protein
MFSDIQMVITLISSISVHVYTYMCFVKGKDGWGRKEWILIQKANGCGQRQEESCFLAKHVERQSWVLKPQAPASFPLMWGEQPMFMALTNSHGRAMWSLFLLEPFISHTRLPDKLGEAVETQLSGCEPQSSWLLVLERRLKRWGEVYSVVHPSVFPTLGTQASSTS